MKQASTGSPFYTADTEEFWPKILGEKVSVGDYISSWVNKMMLYYLFCSKQYPKHKCTQKAKSKHSQTACPSDISTQCLWPVYH